MKRLLFLLSICCTFQANAQPYSISFSGTDLSTVKVQNLTTGVIVDVPASDVLLLSTPTGIPEVNKKSSRIKIYPNPMTDKSTLEIIPPLAGEAIISMCDMSGKVLTQFKGYLENYKQDFSLSGIKNGLHVINVQGNGYQFSEKFILNGKSNGTAVIARVSNNFQAFVEKKSIMNSKGVQGTVDMAYNAGERLKYTALSGNNKTVLTDIPTANKTVTFTFTECKDGDNNYYPVVQINDQLWMAENLKTTKYEDGITAIPLVTDNTAWNSLSTPGFCWYNNNESTYKATYGALYNWYAVGTGILCPAGWHVPTDADWTALTTFLGGESVAGSKLKETGTTHWLNPNASTTNETGFTALPGGYRHFNGTSSYIRENGNLWSKTESDSWDAWFREMYYSSSEVARFDIGFKRYGFSVRCMKD